jgi:hypothetical protein
VLDGGAGNDLLRARDNQVDNVMCGPGADRTILDRGRVVDLVDRACEPRLRRP